MFRIKIFGLLIALILAVSAAGYIYKTHVPVATQTAAAATYQTKEEQNDIYVRFVLEAYDVIQKNYWQKATDEQLSNVFQLSIDKAAGTTTATVKDRAGLAHMLDTVFAAQKDDDARKQLALGTLQVALYNLPPAGRSQLLSAEQKKEVEQTVSNINPNSDLYSELGVASSSSAKEITEAYEEKKQALAASSSPDAEKQLERAQYIKDVLANPVSKERYDETKAEPTVFAHIFGSTLYLNVARMSPDTAGDFIAALNAASSTPLSSLIVDLRGNIGGSLEQVPNIIGIFAGRNQYLFDLYHQSDFQPIRSPIDKEPALARYKEIALLTDNQTQSSAEVMTASLKRFHMATVVGDKTRGWGTVEGQYALTTAMDPNTTYGLLLVYGLTLRDDNNPIDGVGVDPDVSIKDKNWQGKLSQYIRSQSLIIAVEQTVTQPPLK